LRRLIMVMAIVAGALAGCSSQSAPFVSATGATSPEEPSAQATDSTPTPTAAPTFTSKFVSTETGANGNSALLTLSLGVPVAPDQAPAVSGGTLASQSCLTIDSDHDLIVPFDLQVKNLNSTLPLPSIFGASFAFVDTQSSLPLDESVSAVQFYGNGPQCTQIDDSSLQGTTMLVSLELGSELQPGDSDESSGYIQFSQVVQPSYPTGDPALLRNAFLTPQHSDGPSISFNSGAWKAITPPLDDITKGLLIAG
jgi:hypothetical protein